VKYNLFIVILLVVTCSVNFSAFGQAIVWHDTVPLIRLSDFVDGKQNLIKFRFFQEVDYSVTFSTFLFLNWKHEKNANQLAMLQKIKYQTIFDNNQNFRIINIFLHNLGFQIFFDSIIRFQTDDNTLDTRFEFKLIRNLTFNFISILNTRFLNGYDYQTDSVGSQVRILNSSFLTPLFWTFSLGLGWTCPGFGMAGLGISAAKLTFILDKSVYTEQAVPIFYGVPSDKDYLFEYGLSLHIVVDKNFQNRIRWICDILAFKNYNKPIDLTLKNLIDIKINKFLKTSIQTRIFYEERVCKNFQLENIISLGFFLHL